MICITLRCLPPDIKNKIGSPSGDAREGWWIDIYLVCLLFWGDVWSIDWISLLKGKFIWETCSRPWSESVTNYRGSQVLKTMKFLRCFLPAKAVCYQVLDASVLKHPRAPSLKGSIQTHHIDIESNSMISIDFHVRYPSHLWKIVFTHFWKGLVCSLPDGGRLLLLFAY